MERNEIIIMGALAAAFFILRPKAAQANSSGQGTATGAGAGAAAAAPAGGAAQQASGPMVVGPLSWEQGERQTSPEEARWPYSYLTPTSSGSGSGTTVSTNSQTSPTRDPVESTGAFVAMPKPIFDFA